MIVLRGTSRSDIQRALDEVLRRTLKPGRFVLPSQAPSDPTDGECYYASGVLYVYSNGEWESWSKD